MKWISLLLYFSIFHILHFYYLLLNQQYHISIVSHSFFSQSAVFFKIRSNNQQDLFYYFWPTLVLSANLTGFKIIMALLKFNPFCLFLCWDATLLYSFKNVRVNFDLSPLLLKHLILIVFILTISVSYSIFFWKTLNVNLLLVLLLWFFVIIQIDNISFSWFISHLIDLDYVVKRVNVCISTNFHWGLERLLSYVKNFVCCNPINLILEEVFLLYNWK